METIEINIYDFNELNEEAQEKAIESLYDVNVSDSFWYEYILDDAKEIAALMGIDIDQIYFSGFCSQGDGACFTGTYAYQAGALKAVRDYAPSDSELHAIALDFQNIQRNAFYRLKADISHGGHHYHSLCAYIDVYTSENRYEELKQAEDLRQALRDLMNWIYSRLEKEYEYLTSYEAIKETILANECTFTENGEIYL